MADQQTEALIVRQIRERFPRDEIVGEESGYHEGRASAPRWFIDPIDGTRDFAAGGPDWAVHVGLCEGDAVTMGVVFQPRAARLTWGVLEGTPRAGVVDGDAVRALAAARGVMRLSLACARCSRRAAARDDAEAGSEAAGASSMKMAAIVVGVAPTSEVAFAKSSLDGGVGTGVIRRVRDPSAPWRPCSSPGAA